MRFSTIAAVTALLTVTAADAQNVRAPVSTDPGAPTAPSKPARAKKPSAVPPFIVTLANASTHTAVMVIITTEDAIASTSKPLGPKASFEGGGQVDVGEFDICKDKTIRFTD
jgi:hypothetical protein